MVKLCLNELDGLKLLCIYGSFDVTNIKKQKKM